ncbi:CRISPR-associated endonuclease Cas4g/Cas1g [Geochorda subterranea]|uniref:CRISPR-associated endonuclease Cas1 n=1 Tax=Geochorda subterranea TaxID=3109564 RepID=A0ABZ1BQS9_9FIRM|nr:CRISPR-associated endonuclease Cas1 [Limnochorda sp. LNt]WRP14928.1 CRISPR-associated endonuclease Cas1 [Limnochorda sp. LNt]
MTDAAASDKSSTDLLPARMLNEFAYCPRLFYLEWVQGEWEDSADTIEGRYHHRRVDRPGGAAPMWAERSESDHPPPDGPDTESSRGEPQGDDADAGADSPIRARSVLLSAPRLRLIARIDLLEGEGLNVTPVDYKRGEVPDTPEQSWEPDRVLLCAQGLILRENGFSCHKGMLYYVASRRRVEVPFTPELEARTLELVQQALEVAEAGQIPPPLVDSPKCPRCSLVGICLPDETNLLKAGVPSLSGPGETTRSDEGSDHAGTEPEVRRLFPARSDAMPLYVQEQGAQVRRSGERVVVSIRGETRADVRVLDISQVCLIGNVQISAQALRDLAGRGIPICHFSYGGWFTALTTGLTNKNVELRCRQFETAANPQRSLELARRFVAAKILNSRVLLRRNHTDRPEEALDALARLAEEARAATSVESLLGIEGTAARIYFSHFKGMLKPPQTSAGELGFDFEGRNRRPPRDPVNALLSYAYSLLVKDFTVTLLAVGFDPYLGFYHRPKWGKPALALDMMEEFRPIIADSVVITVINNGEITRSDFVVGAGGTALTEPGRRRFIAAYERRLATLVRHPVFGYSVSYRRVFEVQARLLGRYLLGEIPEYPGFVTR